MNKVVHMQEILVKLNAKPKPSKPAKSCTHRKFPDSKQEVNSNNSSPTFRGTKPGYKTRPTHTFLRQLRQLVTSNYLTIKLKDDLRYIYLNI